MIAFIQSNCTHPSEYVEYENKADTGNWCPQDDTYWANYQCNHCGKRWMDDQGKWKGTKIK